VEGVGVAGATVGVVAMAAGEATEAAEATEEGMVAVAGWAMAAAAEAAATAVGMVAAVGWAAAEAEGSEAEALRTRIHPPSTESARPCHQYVYCVAISNPAAVWLTASPQAESCPMRRLTFEWCQAVNTRQSCLLQSANPSLGGGNDGPGNSADDFGGHSVHPLAKQHAAALVRNGSRARCLVFNERDVFAWARAICQRGARTYAEGAGWGAATADASLAPEVDCPWTSTPHRRRAWRPAAVP